MLSETSGIEDRPANPLWVAVGLLFPARSASSGPSAELAAVARVCALQRGRSLTTGGFREVQWVGPLAHCPLGLSDFVCGLLKGAFR
ncbi:hypothetical protein [Hydrogenophaga crassostreae]|uniref:hypothetical protein n=1 Tax=Hydrogenophaga crassostreae TaxID=1763535 RepID=UPI000AC3DDFF|nr:hypothetical protein [Hydrogenophaga crassostreae]